MHVCETICGYVQVCIGTHRESCLLLLELQLKVVVSHQVWILREELGSSGKGDHALN